MAQSLNLGIITHEGDPFIEGLYVTLTLVIGAVRIIENVSLVPDLHLAHV